MRARLALQTSGAKVEIREIILRHKPAHMLEISPKGTVPVLQLQDGTIIDESYDIMIWALGQQDPNKWLDANGTTTKLLIERNDNEFKNALDRYKYPERYEDVDTDKEFQTAAEILKDLNARIQQNGALILGHSTLADYAIFPFIRQLSNVDKVRFNKLRLYALEKWLHTHIKSPIFETIMHKYYAWKPEDTPIFLKDSAASGQAERP